MLIAASRSTKLMPTGPSPTSMVTSSAKAPPRSGNVDRNETDRLIPANGVLPFQVQCKSAIALVNERRIDFVRAKNVHVIGRLDGSSREKKKDKKKELPQLTEMEAVERVLVWQQTKKIGPGFANLGNTCYLNSVLQCLTYTPCFAQFLLEKTVSASFNGGVVPFLNGHDMSKSSKTLCKNGLSSHHNSSFCSVRCMSRLLQLVHGTNAVRVVQPKELVMNVRHISKRFRIGRQEDSHEFFRLLLDSMQSSCLRKARIKSETHAAASTTFVHRIFGGKLKSSLKCAKCGYVSERVDDFLDLSLELSNGVHSVRGALRHFTAVEKLDNCNAWKCSSCGKKSCAEKGLTIAACPNVLVIQLKRFDLLCGKIKRHIEFPSLLDIASGMSKNCDDRRRGRTKYELHAVLVHAGFSTDCGHYYAFVKGASGQWYEMNDDSVRWVSLDTVLEQKAYMLFYSRVLPPSERPKPKVEIVQPEVGNVLIRKVENEISVEVAAPLQTKTKELDMNSFLASLKTSVTQGVVETAGVDKSLVVVPAELKNEYTTMEKFKVTAKQSVASSIGVVGHRMQRVFTCNFGSHVDRLYRFRPALWKTYPRLVMTRSVEEVPVETTAEMVVTSGTTTIGTHDASVPSSDATRVPFDIRQLKKVGVHNASLFGREVDKWTGETDVESSETTSSNDAVSHEIVDNELAAKHDRVLNTLKQEEWKHRNAGRQDYWDETLDTGKVKNVKKRKEFVPNEGRKNVFQTTLMRKTKDAKRQRTTRMERS
uniref:Ubiquitin carboxyl-terminal hydrolase n=1 Tax=Hyaloperonospora arabidopsidis (strain Emoy2) TaxID=559515 RepID=M4BS66_HYAAE